MKVIIYVEGPSDVAALNTLLRSLIDEAAQVGIEIRFIGRGGKSRLVGAVALRALDIVRNAPQDHVFAVPDLYPRNVGVPHSTCDELRNALVHQFAQHCQRLQLDPTPLLPRFHVHCLKHDLEVLLLAAEGALMAYLGSQSFAVAWRRPPEDQNFDRPPKRIVERLFSQHLRRDYVDTVSVQ